MEKTHYYTPEEASRELEQRKDLRKIVEKWWEEKGLGLPPIHPVYHQPIGVIARHVATCRYEDVVFYLMAARAGLQPCWLEYVGDKFVDCSPFKRSLLRRYVCDGRGKRGGWRLRVDQLGDISRWKGRQISEIVTESGESLLDFHHRLQETMLPEPVRRFDITAWLRQAGVSAQDYYTAKLSLYAAHSVLFEDYHGGESGVVLDSFTLQVFEPARRRITELFGVTPLIVPLPWRDEFSFYPADPRWEKHGVVPDMF